MDDSDLAERFEAHRRHLRAVAHGVLGSPAEADDAVQEAWLRVSRSGTAEVTNLGGWLTTVVARIALDRLRARTSRREEPLDAGLPDPVVEPDHPDAADPESAALQADAVSVALLVVLETLSPTERLVFVLHDLFAVPFVEIGAIVGRSPGAAKQLASRARRRIRGRVPAVTPADRRRHREVVAAFLAAARGGDLEGLLAVLDPDVVLRVDRPVAGPDRVAVFTGAGTVAAQALNFAHLAAFARPAIVNGAPGLVTLVDGEPFSVQEFTVHRGRITAMHLYADRGRLRGVRVAVD